MGDASISVSIVDACVRSGSGGSPTAVVVGRAGDEQLHRMPASMGTSHAVLVDVASRSGAPAVALRFFTAEGELPACGHGTVAALAFLAEHGQGSEYRATLHAGGRTFVGRAARRGGLIVACIEMPDIDLRPASAHEVDLIGGALGLPAEFVAPGSCVASPGRPRLLLPVLTPSAVAALRPDFDGLRNACDQLGLLGCFAHTLPTASRRVTARMFAPSIGVPEDIANANSTACLAARLARDGISTITVDMGDSVRRSATITAAMRPTAAGTVIEVGGAASVGPTHRM